LGGRCAFACAVALALVLLAGPALAGGYNDSGYSYGLPYGTNNTAWYVRDAEGGSQIASPRGPHGGYTSTTNKCKDCHAVHLAEGAFMLTRVDDRFQVCDYCHTGGGGSKTNIQMDNEYDSDTALITASRGDGVGHTIGYPGNAPVDIQPAYGCQGGLMCFDCHSVHGNSDRVLTTFANPGRAIQPTSLVDEVYKVGDPGYDHSVSGWGDNDLDNAPDTDAFWGVTPDEGNIVTNGAGDGSTATRWPIWPTGRFLLTKNPHREILGAVEITDTVVSNDATGGVNKIAIDWDDPLWTEPLAYTGEQDQAGGNTSTPMHPWPDGILSVSEFCTDCHDGAAGASTQRALVWKPNEASNDVSGTYVQTYAHDAQPRICGRQLYLSPGGTPDNPGDPDDGTDDNYGPNCRNCHTGASSCDQCHGVDSAGVARDAFGTTVLTEGETTFMPNSYVHVSATAQLSGQCVDGGFSFPHRTLGANLLKDELYGIDYDGTPVAPGEPRDSGLQIDLMNIPAAWYRSVLSENATITSPGYGTWVESGTQLSTDTASLDNGSNGDGTTPPNVTVAENLDSVCIDCHGDATYWNGDDPAYRDPARGWELILKGLP
jgi:predicted CXXCH cytochrome family protein